MAMRYIIRRQNPEDLAFLKKEFPSLDTQLSKASDGLRKTLEVTIGNLERVTYQLMTKKKGSDWVWTCPSIEMVAENEQGLFNLLKKFSLPPPAHLAHLSA